MSITRTQLHSLNGFLRLFKTIYSCITCMFNQTVFEFGRHKLKLNINVQTSFNAEVMTMDSSTNFQAPSHAAYYL